MKKTIFCSNCNHKIKQTDNYCSNCGINIRKNNVEINHPLTEKNTENIKKRKFFNT